MGVASSAIAKCLPSSSRMPALSVTTFSDELGRVATTGLSAPPALEHSPGASGECGRSCLCAVSPHETDKVCIISPSVMTMCVRKERACAHKSTRPNRAGSPAFRCLLRQSRWTSTGTCHATWGRVEYTSLSCCCPSADVRAGLASRTTVVCRSSRTGS